jgi:hypothetical protein
VSLGLRPRLCRSPSLPSLAGAGADRIALELGQPAEQGQHQTPCAVVVSAHASPSERKPAFFPAIAESQVQAMPRALFFYLPSMLLSGFMFPFQGMPSWAQALGEVLPLTHFVRAQAGQETPKLLSFRSAGAARESGTHEHRT